ncbi:MAG TPA: T9SS type A sorting domain-containing protein [Chitinophagales bacterium]|nr:T9SS type A sorting domain-containing protein [Chitinophagales bacterium]
MKKLLPLIFILTGIFHLENAKAQNWEWAKKAGGTQNEGGYGVSNDAAGNIYVTGVFRDSIFKNGKKLISNGSDDIFVAKYNSAGTLKWTRQIGGNGADGYSLGSTTDASGNTYVIGSIYGSAYFGNTLVTGAGYNDIFLVKYSPSGNLLWVKTYGGSENDVGLGVAINSAGKIFISGYFYGTAHFDNITLTSAGIHDIFVAKCNGSGNILWANRIGGTSYDNSASVAVDTLGNVYATGYFNNTATFSGSNTTLVSSGSDDIFIVKYNQSGSLQWATKAGGTGVYDIGNDISLDHNLNVYITGQFESTCTFGTTSLVSAGTQDIFIACLNNSGSFLWAVRAGSTLSDVGTGIRSDNAGNLYATGWYNNNSTFDGQTKTTVGGLDVFVARYSSSGSLVWFKSAGSENDDWSFAITQIGPDVCAITGRFQSDCYFDQTTLHSKGAYDFFVAKTAKSPGKEMISLVSDPLLIYPNPVALNGSVFINMPESFQQATFSIYDLQGKLVRTIFIEEEPGNDFQNISLNEIGAGVYVYQFTTSSKTETGKLCITE